MLNLKRKLGQDVLIHVPAGNPNDLTIQVRVSAIDTGGMVKLGLDAPHDVTFIRPEVNDPERADRTKTPDDEKIRTLFAEAWKQGHGILPYEKSKWIELQALLQAKGINL